MPLRPSMALTGSENLRSGRVPGAPLAQSGTRGFNVGNPIGCNDGKPDRHGRIDSGP
ncbi:hypothetical protein NSK11_contig00208-0010, partial [Nocardia seriolae]